MPRIPWASWFETRGVATLLTMRVRELTLRVKDLILERACARLEDLILRSALARVSKTSS
jgi:hypothetical protein